jgi:hypothetical protein
MEISINFHRKFLLDLLEITTGNRVQVAGNGFWPTEYQPSSHRVPRVTGSGLRVARVSHTYGSRPHRRSRRRRSLVSSAPPTGGSGSISLNSLDLTLNLSALSLSLGLISLSRSHSLLSTPSLISLSITPSHSLVSLCVIG